ncbi:unnamed protein product, partial [Heligmosomoides polygyrus]|uniref:Lipase_3 domain-containing protein n=1 Tax=Heligmosomoides polygyrus TaxID=6339 RepID=A0A183FIG1_HELPZ
VEVGLDVRRLPHDFFYALETISAGAYAEDPNTCLRPHNASLVYRITLPCDYLRDECWGYVGMTDGWILIAFRGTRTKIQLITELIETMSEPKRKLRSGGSVQHYFFVALQSIWKPMHTVIQKLRKVSIMFTGHSLGGALASLASTVYAHRHPSRQFRVHLITYGQPRVGNYEYAESHSRLVRNSWRIVHKYDLVAHLPACAFRIFSHSCASLLNHSPYHHGTEVWFPTNMTQNALFRICDGLPLYEDDSCSAQHLFLSGDMHDYGSIKPAFIEGNSEEIAVARDYLFIYLFTVRSTSIWTRQ